MMIHTKNKRKPARRDQSDFDAMMGEIIDLCACDNVPWDHFHQPDSCSGNIVCIVRVGPTARMRVRETRREDMKLLDSKQGIFHPPRPAKGRVHDRNGADMCSYAWRRLVRATGI